MTNGLRRLGTLESAELLLRDLYLDLRRNVRAWSEVTRQTPQARMGYIGQHLVSVVTGYPGGRSGARGHDLVLPGGRHAEIKTCYRVDQLGQCANPSCKAAVSSIEEECPVCGSTAVVRKDDSKWLIGIRNDDEMRTLFDPAVYYLVLFDFAAPVALTQEEEDTTVVTQGAPDINARIWQVNPKHPGFALCMVDYYVNIRANSSSKAPFNFWPYSLKFQLMRPLLMYHAIIKADDTITTKVFQGAIGDVEYYPIACFAEMKGSRKNLGDDKLRVFADRNGIALPTGASRIQILDRLDRERSARGWSDEWLAVQLAELIYREGVRGSEGWLPTELR